MMEALENKIQKALDTRNQEKNAINRKYERMERNLKIKAFILFGLATICIFLLFFLFLDLVNLL